jgi:hypothetical protein
VTAIGTPPGRTAIPAPARSRRSTRTPARPCGSSRFSKRNRSRALWSGPIRLFTPGVSARWPNAPRWSGDALQMRSAAVRHPRSRPTMRYGPRSPGRRGALIAPFILTNGFWLAPARRSPAARQRPRSRSARPARYERSAWSSRCGTGMLASTVSGAASWRRTVRPCAARGAPAQARSPASYVTSPPLRTVSVSSTTVQLTELTEGSGLSAASSLSVVAPKR